MLLVLLFKSGRPPSAGGGPQPEHVLNPVVLNTGRFLPEKPEPGASGIKWRDPSWTTKIYLRISRGVDGR